MNHKPKRYFCSFADRRLRLSLKRIGKQARESKFFDEIYLFNESKLDRNFKKEFEIFLQPATFYLCAWKPQVIIQLFKKMEVGDLLLYADSGCHINRFGLKRINEYFDMVEKSESGILATAFSDNMPERNWTKGDTFDYFGKRDDLTYTDTAQIQATTFIIQKRPQTILFISEWMDIFRKAPDLAYRDVFKHPNLDGFIDHRSDQSFFSILGKLNRITLISADEVQLSSAWETDMKAFPVWAKRDKVFDYSLLHNFSWQRVLDGIKRKLSRGFNSFKV